MMSMKMVMLSLMLTLVKMKSKSTVLGCGRKPDSKEVWSQFYETVSAEI
jgi:hypothetical protein